MGMGPLLPSSPQHADDCGLVIGMVVRRVAKCVVKWVAVLIGDPMGTGAGQGVDGPVPQQPGHEPSGYSHPSLKNEP